MNPTLVRVQLEPRDAAALRATQPATTIARVFMRTSFEADHPLTAGGPPLLCPHPTPRGRRPRRAHPTVTRQPVRLRVQVLAPLGLALDLLHGDAVLLRPRVLADAGDLPADLHLGLARADREGVLGDFLHDLGLGPRVRIGPIDN